MEFRIWFETRLDGRILERELISSVERPASGIGPEEIGLELVEGKAVLRKVQARIVQTQVDVLSAAHRRCFLCGQNQRVKDLRTRTARTVFGTLEVSCRLSAYVGVYRSDYYGQLEVSEDHGLLWMRLPADGSLFTLTHWDGDTFVYRYKEEPGAITRGVKFTLGATPKVLLENLATEGDAVFTKLAP